MIDASAALSALLGSQSDQALRTRLTRITCHAPHLFDAEVGHVLARRERAGQLTAAEAQAALRAAHRLIDHRYAHAGPLAELAWDLRHNLSFYDALYVALAARLGLPLLTADGRLARAPGLPCPVELV